MGEPTSSPAGQPPGQPAPPSMLSIYLQRSASAQLSQQSISPRPSGLQSSSRQPSLQQAAAVSGHGPTLAEQLSARWAFPGQQQAASDWAAASASQPLLSAMPAVSSAAISASPFAAVLVSAGMPMLRSSSQPALSQTSVLISPSSSQLPRSALHLALFDELVL